MGHGRRVLCEYLRHCGDSGGDGGDFYTRDQLKWVRSSNELFVSIKLSYRYSNEKL